MIPREREMVERLKDKSFTLLGINSDASRSVLKERIKKEKITWPNIYGGPTGKNQIVKQWNVFSWPTIYILDHRGVIHSKTHSCEAMEAAVNELLKKTK